MAKMTEGDHGQDVAIARFFQKFEDETYQYNATNNSNDEFHRLRVCKHWPKKTKSRPDDQPNTSRLRQEHATARAEFLDLIGTTLALYSGVTNDNSDGQTRTGHRAKDKSWTQLCHDLNIKPVPDTTAKLREVSLILIIPSSHDILSYGTIETDKVMI